MFRFTAIIFALWFLLFSLFSLGEQTPLKKSIRVGEKFNITIYTENKDEHFEIASLDPTLLSNILYQQTSDKRIFEFLPLTTGELALSIRKVIGTNITDNYLVYHLTIKPRKSSRIKITRPGEKKKAAKKSKKPRNDEERLQFEVIKNLYATSVYAAALKEITNFQKQFPQSKHSYATTYLHSQILAEQGKLAAAKEVLEVFSKNNRTLGAEKKIDLYQRLAELSGKMEQNEAAITLLLTALALPQLSLSNAEYLNYQLANNYLREKKYRPAFFYYQKLYSNHSKKKNLYDLNLYDDILLQMATVLENSPELRDVERAYQIYGELIETYPQSPWLKEAKRKREYLIRHFIDPK